MRSFWPFRSRVARRATAASLLGLAAIGTTLLVVLPQDAGTAGETASSTTIGRRDLQVVLEAPGTLQRQEQTTITHLGQLTPVPAGGPAQAGAAPPGQPPQPPAGAPAGPPAAGAPAPPGAPGEPGGGGPPQPPAPPPPMTTPAPPPTAPPTTVPPPPPPPPPTAPPPTTVPPTTVPPPPTCPPTEPDLASSQPVTRPCTGAVGAPSAVQLASYDTPLAAAAVGSAESQTLTSLLAAGAAVERGTILYTVDTDPVAAMLGNVPAWRALHEGVDAGLDVRQLEENLSALGFGKGLTVDEEFTSASGVAVADWERSIGRSDPDSTIELGDVVFLTQPAVVTAATAHVGDPLRAGAPVLTVGSQSQVVRARVPVDKAPSWTAGSAVTVQWADGKDVVGTVVAVGRDVTDEAIEVTVALSSVDPSRAGGSPATVLLVGERRTGVLAVPVSALVDGPDGSPAVRVLDAAGERLVSVTRGSMAGGWVEIESGLSGGERVRLPG